MHAVVVCNLLFFMLLLKLLYIILFPISFSFTMKNIPPAVDHFSQMLSNLFAFILFYVYLPFLTFFRFLWALSCTGVFSTCLQHVYTNQLEQNLGKIQTNLQVLMKVLTQNNKLFYRYNILFLHFAPNGLC